MMLRMEIVRPSASASDRTLENFKRLLPGTVAVALEDPPLPGILVHYEGDLYGRESDRPPTPEERRTYAKIAAGRAAERYPTTAVFQVNDWYELEAIGFVLWDTARRSSIVRFQDGEGLAWRRNPSTQCQQCGRFAKLHAHGWCRSCYDKVRRSPNRCFWVEEDRFGSWVRCGQEQYEMGLCLDHFAYLQEAEQVRKRGRGWYGQRRSVWDKWKV